MGKFGKGPAQARKCLFNLLILCSFIGLSQLAHTSCFRGNCVGRTYAWSA